MGWNDIDYKLKRRLDRKFVSCEEDYELAQVKTAIKQEFPYLSESSIIEAIKRCCKKIPAPRPRVDFLRCVRDVLE